MVKTEKFVLILSIVVMVIFIFAIIFASKGLEIDVPECLPPQEEPFEEGKVVKLDENTYQLFFIAQMWRFDPSTVEIPAGSEVDIYLSSKDVVHGFHIMEKDVNLMAVHGSINYTTARFEEPGVYNIVCHEYCGAGHQNMRGKIVVKE